MPEPSAAGAIEVICNSITPFRPDLSVDTEALTAHVRRVTGAGCSVNIGVGGSGESYGLTESELFAAFTAAVGGRQGGAGIYGVVRESSSAEQVVAIAEIALSAGVDRLHVYGVDMRHNIRPTEHELETYFRAVLDRVRTPVVVGFAEPLDMMVRLCADYEQVVGINTGFVWDTTTGALAHYLRVVDAISAVAPRIRFYSSRSERLLAEHHAATGWYSIEANIVPERCREFADQIEDGRFVEARSSLAAVVAVADVVMRAGGPSRDQGNAVRGVKAALAVLGLGSATARPPFQPLPAARVRRLRSELAVLGLADGAGDGWPMTEEVGSR